MTHAPWPRPLAPCAYHGVLGEMVQAMAPETEADPGAILVQLLVMFGNCIGRTPRFRVGADLHHLNLFAAIVGTTAKGRKGMSKNQARQAFEPVDPDWTKDCLAGGLSSGEGVIFAVRDAVSKQHPIKEKNRVVGYEDVVEDAGVSDKRLLAVETELASPLKVMTREGNTLSPVLRQAWDGQDLRTLTKTSALRSTAPHISLIAHVTADELRHCLEETEAANGFGNRFLWVLAKRSKELPHGGNPVDLDAFTPRLMAAVDAARRAPELRRDAAANRLWERIYSRLSAGRPGMWGAMTARAEAQTLRLSGLFALADASPVITPPHVYAALELWRYCFESAAYLFGDRIGHPVADAILAKLRREAPASVTKSELSALFSRNQPASKIDEGLALLVEYRLAKTDHDRSAAGRPVERWFYSGDELDEINEVTNPDGGERSFNSSISSPTDSDEHRSQPNRPRPPHERL